MSHGPSRADSFFDPDRRPDPPNLSSGRPTARIDGTHESVPPGRLSQPPTAAFDARPETSMSHGNNYKDPEDMFADTRMSFGDHLEELRLHLWRAVVGFGVALFLSFFIGRPVLSFIAHPVEVQLQKFYDRRYEKIMAEWKAGTNPELEARNQPRDVELLFDRDALKRLAGVFGVRDPELPEEGTFLALPTRIKPLQIASALRDANLAIGRRPALTTLSAQEAFLVYFQVCLVCGLIIGSPWIFIQIWMFIAAGLYPHEKRYVHVYLPFSLGLFLGGVALCQFVVIPKALEALLWFNEWIGLEPDLRLNEWLSFAILMPLVFGLSFQTPLVMLFLERIGLVDVNTYRAKRRLAWFLLAIFAAVVSPSIDAVSMMFLWVPLGLLFELGIWLCALSPRPTGLDVDVPDSEEMIEV